MQGEAALFVCGIGAVGVRSSRRNGAFARGVDEGVAVEHVESLTLHSASHLETASDWVWALVVFNVVVAVRLNWGPELGARGLVSNPSEKNKPRQTQTRISAKSSRGWVRV